MPDQYLGNYRVVRRIGAGGMAKVYLGEHRDVASLKVVLKVLSDSRLIERFRQEADKLALLDGHPNVCQIKGFFSHEEDTVIAMEFIDGASLDDLLHQQDPMPMAEALRIVTDVVGVLEFAHQRGVFHRDIKPSNIMLDKSGQVKVIDFGIAKGKSDPNLTTAGAMCGTPAYMAPEQFTGTEDTDYSLVDVYAVGTTLFRLITGQMPFTAENEFMLRDAKLFQDPPSPRSINGTIPPELEGVILKAIDKDPANRFQSMTEFRHALLKARGKQESEVTPTHAPTIATVDRALKGSRTSGKKSKLPMLIGGIVLIVVLAVVGYVLFGSDEDRADTSVLSLIAPANGADITTTRSPILKWRDRAEGSVGYELEYAVDSLFSDPELVTGIRVAQYPVEEELPDGRYFWRVYPVQADGALGRASGTFSFVIDLGEAGDQGVSDTAAVAQPTPGVVQGQLVITVEPSGSIFLDNRRVVANGNRYSANVDTGTYAIRVENSDSKERVLRGDMRVRPGETSSRAFRFTFPPPPPQEQFGEVRVGSKPRGADIYIDGELQKQQTNYTFRLPAGRHIVLTIMTVEGVRHEQADTLTVVADSVHRAFFDFE